ncbi:MAG: LysM peptidoglycan-binding domain-containing protein [Rhodothermales bacterium]|nr:LysM peptidoglycan-binding domain-containing protein [Rhodothermales bacterium]
MTGSSRLPVRGLGLALAFSALLVFVVAPPASVSAQALSGLDVKPAEQLPAPPLRVPATLVSGGALGQAPLPTVADLYRRHAAVLEAQANEDYILAESRLAAIVHDLQPLLEMPEYLGDERFAELYQTILTEHDRFFGPGGLASADEVFAVREQTFAALNDLENPTESPDSDAARLPEPMSVAPTSVEMTVNKAVTTAMQVLLEKRPKTLKAWHERAGTWFPVIEKVFAEEGVPDELKYLAMIESGLRPSVRSRAAAVGMWQFIAATGRAYDLVVDGWVDERMDPEKATRAAARHLRDLYKREGDWHIAMAGYNCSPRCINRAKRAARAKGIEDPTFWDMYPYLPRETRGYIPQYIATSIMLSNPEAYGLRSDSIGTPFAYELVAIRGSLALRDVARMAGTSTEVVTSLNPALRRGYLPPSAKPYPLRLPIGTSERFMASYAELPPQALRPPGEHIVRRGDTLSEIASTYGVSVSRLRSDNNLRGSLIKPGQRLVVPASDYGMPVVEVVTEAEPMSVAYEAMTRRPILSTDAIEFRNRTAIPDMQRSQPTQAIAASAAPSQPQGTRVNYTVRRGDTLSEIAEAHGVGLSRVRAWNSISGSRIRTGQRLVIYVPEGWTGRAQGASGPERSRATAQTHRVQRGDNLTGIASKYGISLSQLRTWNDLKSDRIYPGTTLKVSAPN